MANSVKRIYRDCIIDNSNTADVISGPDYLTKAAIYIRAAETRGPVFGNADFIDCTVINDTHSVYGLFVDQEGIPFEDITVTNLQVENSSIDYIHNLP